MRLRQGLPNLLRRKATEALTNSRHAFDQATFAARNLTAGPSRKSIYFPWSTTPRDLERLLEARGIDKRLWDIFASHEPYPTSDTHAGGNDIIRALATIANDKHTVGLGVSAHIAMSETPILEGKGFVESLSILMPHWDPIKNEAELMRWRGDVEVRGDYKFDFEVIFKDSRLSKPVSAQQGLIAFCGKAKMFVEQLQARCVKLG